MSKMEITLVPADDEPHFKDPQQQVAFKAFSDEAESTGASVMPYLYMQKSMDGGSWLTGTFILEALPYVSPLGTGLLGYLAAKMGRKVRVKIGDIEIEAGSPKEVEKLLAMLDKRKSDSDASS